MSNVEKVQDVMKKHSDANIDEYIQTSSFSDKVADVGRPPQPSYGKVLI